MTRKGMHGLKFFISDIRNCKCKEAEIMRINKELANIRSKFQPSNLLNGYNKKKYICKLIFIFLLGYDFDCGRFESISLLHSTKFSEKNIGYLFISVIMSEKSNLMHLVLQCVKDDLGSLNSENKILALNYLANMANFDMAKALGERVLKLLFFEEVTSSVKKSAILSLLRLFRLKPDIISKKEDADRITCFFNDPDLGVLTAALSLIEALAAESKLNKESCFHSAVHRLYRIIKYPSLEVRDYNYYYVPAPWLSIKLLKILQYLPFLTGSSSTHQLVESVEQIFNRAQGPPISKKIEYRNCRNAVMIEAVNYIYHINTEYALQMRAYNILEMNLKQRDPNLRYLALETMNLLTKSDICRERIKLKLKSITDFLTGENDTCIRKNAAKLLCNLCDRSNVNEVIENMFVYLENCDITVKVESILKVALLAENYLSDSRCYINVILNMLKFHGQYVTTAVWYKSIQLVTNNSDLRGYAAKLLFDGLQIQPHYDIVVAVSAYILGEFGNLIAGDERSNPNIQLQLLHSNFAFCSHNTKAILLTTYMKFFNLFPEIKQNVKNIFVKYIKHSDPEIQQRAIEYSKLCEIVNPNQLAAILDEMPCFKSKIFRNETGLQRETGFNEKSFDRKEDHLERAISYNEAMQHYSIRKAPGIDVFHERSLTLPQKVCASNSYYDTLINEVSFDNRTYSREAQFVSTHVLLSNKEAVENLIWHKNGILYESNILLIYVESEFRKHQGFIRLKYKNKTCLVLDRFMSFLPNDNCNNKLHLRTMSCNITIPVNEEIVQDIQVECIQDFICKPVMDVNFLCDGLQEKLDLQLPVTLNKFIKPVNLTYDQFFDKWTLMQPCKEFTDIFPAKHIMNKVLLMKKLNGLGFSTLENASKNNNFLCAGVFHSKSLLVGILIQLEIDFPNLMFNLSIKSIKEIVSQEILKLIKLIF